MRYLEAGGVIEGYRALLNREHVGLGLMVFVAVSIQDHADKHAEAFRRAVRAMPDVVACHVTSGVHDFVLQVVAPDLSSYRNFALKRLVEVAGVSHIKSSFALETVKDEAILPLNHIAL